MSKRRGLGRGLDALLGSEPDPAEASTTGSDGPRELEIDRLEPNRFQPRSHFDETGLEELTKSIRAQGIVQPIVVTAKEGGRGFSIIAGERRWRAARKAGLERVPVVIRQVDDDQQLLELALVENIQRADLNAIEEAEAYKALSESFGLSQENIASRVGKGRTTVTNFIRLLRLPEPVQDLVRTGQLSAGQARPLLALTEAAKQVELADRAVAEGLSARELEALAAKKGAAPAKKKAPDLDVHTREAVDRLTQSLQTKVDIQRKKRGGTVRIHFHSEDELIRLYDRLITGET